VIGYYVHHQGSGHLHRAASILAHLESDATVLSSLPPPPRLDRPWVILERDDGRSYDRTEADVDAHGTLHWVPRRDPGLRRRTRRIVDWADQEQPSLAVVDVSVEVSLLLRLAGVPIVVMAMPGDRADPAHVLAYEMADLLLAPWPQDAANGWSARWRDKTYHVGAISRYDGRPRTAPPSSPGPRGVLLAGTGGSSLTEDYLRDVVVATPGWSWTIAAAGRRLTDDELWSALCGADVVVTHAGQNAVADVAAARVPAVVVAEPRPFDEQVGTVRALHAQGTAVALHSWPPVDEWPALLTRAQALGGGGWTLWSMGDGAAQAAKVLDELVARA
jgi:hypothetical protein